MAYNGPFLVCAVKKRHPLALNFTGKIVKPFSTHEGSGLGSIMQDINKFCVGADIKEGLAIRGSDAKSSKEKIESWCK